MAGLRADRIFYGTALLLMPFSYATKFLVGMSGLTWIDPALILSLVLLLFIKPSFSSLSIAVMASAFLSALIGAILFPAVDPYDMVREPVRISLALTWFWVSVYFIRRHHDFVVRMLSLSALLQLGVALWMWLTFFLPLPLPAPTAAFLQERRTAQLLWLGGFPIPRMVGTFTEGPPLGLFMFCVFVVLSIAILVRGSSGRLLKAGVIGSLCGILGTLADQVLLGLLLWLLLVGFGTRRSRLRRPIWIMTGAVGALAVAMYLGPRVLGKLSQTGSPVQADIYARSGPERLFHIRYAWHIMIEQPATLLLGIGPGRYGDYAAETGLFPATVTPQVTLVAWLVEQGMLGLVCMCAFVLSVTKRAIRRHGNIAFASVVSILLAHAFQADWKWESWFFALAYLYVLAEFPSSVALYGATPLSDVNAPTLTVQPSSPSQL